MSDLPPELLEAVQESDHDPERQSREPEGWLKFYVECPDCEVPMARTTVESEDIDMDGARTAVRSEHRAVCPECRKVASLLRVERVTANFEDIGQAFEDD